MEKNYLEIVFKDALNRSIAFNYMDIGIHSVALSVCS